MFGRQLDVDKNAASTVREVEGYRITITVERLDEQPITPEEAAVVLTGNVSTMFTQRVSFGGRPR